MRKLIALPILLWCASATSQDLKITPSQVDRIYFRELQYQSDLQAQSEVIDSQSKSIRDLRKAIEGAQTLINGLQDANEALYKENATLAVKAAHKPPKRFGLGFSVGYGAYFAEKEVRIAPVIAVSLNYSLIRF